MRRHKMPRRCEEVFQSKGNYSRYGKELTFKRVQKPVKREDDNANAIVPAGRACQPDGRGMLESCGGPTVIVARGLC